jgi:hypothetical protein
MVTRSFKTFGCVFTGVLAAMAMGCSGGGADGADGASVEKVEAASQQLIVSNPNPPPVFESNPLGQGPNCIGKPQTNFVAYATTTSASDPNTTTYTHTSAGGCNPGDSAAYCAHQSDLWSIPNAHGFHYRVTPVTINLSNCDPNGGCPGVVGSGVFYLQGIADYGKSYWYKPWNYQSGESAPWLNIGSNSHPPYGADAKSADWLKLWNLSYTYSAAPISDTHQECVAVWVPTWGTSFRRIDFFSSASRHDPSGPVW